METIEEKATTYAGTVIAKLIVGEEINAEDIINAYIAGAEEEQNILKDFLQKYVNMRNLQKEYFKTRDKSILQQSKSAEKELDNLADNYLKQ